MATSYTIKQFLQGIVLKEVQNEFSDLTDVIDVLSEGNSEMTQELTSHPFAGIDAGVVTTADVDGTATAGNSTFANRTYLETSFDVNRHKEVSLTIALDNLISFGISKDVFNSERKLSIAECESFLSPKLMSEISKLATKIKQKRRAEVVALLTNLGTASATASEKPLGLASVDTAISRTTAWAYTNKLTAVLSSSTLDHAVDIMAGNQKTVLNDVYGVSAPMMLIHASSYSLASTIFTPDITVNVNNRNSSDGIDVVMKAVGVYGDTANSDDWVLLGKNHTIHRLLVDLGMGSEIMVTFNWDAKNNLKMSVLDRSQMVIDSCIDIVKSDLV